MKSGKCIMPQNRSSGNLKIQINCTDPYARFIKNQELAIEQTATGRCWNIGNGEVIPNEGQTIDVRSSCKYQFDFIGK